jgi:hypothetical protein
VLPGAAVRCFANGSRPAFAGGEGS